MLYNIDDVAGPMSALGMGGVQPNMADISRSRAEQEANLDVLTKQRRIMEAGVSTSASHSCVQTNLEY